jgi:hypothetical protein
VLALVCLALATSRLQQATDMPGLAAIELVVLALPWSLLLGAPPFAHAPLFADAALVVIGVIMNGALVAGLAGKAEARWRSASRRGSTGRGTF